MHGYGTLSLGGLPDGRVLFFFSSRRRHTRLVSDWSSDVCSSDLERDLGRADVLRDAARLAARDAGTANPVEEGRLAMVHVSEDGHDGLANRSHRHRTKNQTILEG